MDEQKVPNTQFLEDLKVDIKAIYTYFKQDQTIPHLESIYQQFSLDCIANPVQPQSQEFMNTFFISIVCCIYYATIKDDLLLFILLIYIMKSVYFNQTKTHVQIYINYEKLVTINEYLNYAEAKCNSDAVLNVLLDYCIECIDSLKYYCGLIIYIDKDGNCLPIEDSKLIMNDIEEFEKQLEDLEKYLNDIIDEE